MKNKIIEAIEKHKIIAILRNIDEKKLIDTVEALYTICVNLRHKLSILHPVLQLLRLNRQAKSK